MERLTRIGFQPAAQWLLKDGRLELELTGVSEQNNVLYAFVCDEEVLYVGKTIKTLRRRLYGYLKPSATQVTNSRNNKSLLELLLSGREIFVFAWPDHGLHRYGDFTINMAAALEDSIIETLAPAWNGGRGQRIVEAPDESDPPDNSQEARLEDEAVESAGEAFTVEIGDTYFSKGYFNVPIRATGLFGPDKSAVSVYCGRERALVRAWVNRTANLSGTPRIMGGAALRNWFQANMEGRQTVEVRVLSPTEIAIRIL